MGIIANPTTTPELHSEVLAEAELLVLMRKDHPLASLEALRPRDMAVYPIITNTRHSLYDFIEKEFRADGVDLNVAIAANHHMTTCLLLDTGNAVAIVDPWMPREIFPDLARRKFRPKLKIRARLVWSNSRPMSRIAEAFAQELRNVAREGAPAT
jgi:DNA-binding transcriptional LysR family regulator